MTRSLLLAGLGIVGFSGSFPATRVAVVSFGATELAFARALLAASLSLLVLLLRRSSLPPRSAWVGLGLVTFGVVLGFPLLSSAALAEVDASHAAVVVALLPLATSAIAVWRTNERPHPRFWMAAGAGALLVLGFVLRDPHVGATDVWLVLAILGGALGYAEGARLARTMPAIEVIAWANVLGAPIALAGLLSFGDVPRTVPLEAWLGLVVRRRHQQPRRLRALVCRSCGAASRRLRRPTASRTVDPSRVTLCWSVLFLGEQAPPDTWPVAIGVVIAVAVAARASKSVPVSADQTSASSA
ncbi:MAG: DMT family transporter [Polyangiales bacterium]